MVENSDFGAHRYVRRIEFAHAALLCPQIVLLHAEATPEDDAVVRPNGTVHAGGETACRVEGEHAGGTGIAVDGRLLAASITDEAGHVPSLSGNLAEVQRLLASPLVVDLRDQDGTARMHKLKIGATFRLRIIGMKKMLGCGSGYR